MPFCIWGCANVGVLGRTVTPLPSGLVGSTPTTLTGEYVVLLISGKVVREKINIWEDAQGKSDCL